MLSTGIGWGQCSARRAIRSPELFMGSTAAAKALTFIWTYWTACLLIVASAAPGLTRNPNCTSSLPSFRKYGVITPRHFKVYVADLPRRFTMDLHDEYHDFSYYSRLTYERPFGVPKTEDGVIWNSNQFSSQIWFHKQLIASPLRVFDAAEADVIYVPLFTTYLVGFWHSYKRNRANDTVAAFYRDVPSLLPLLGTKPHIVILPRIEIDYSWLDDTPTGLGLTSKAYEHISRHFTFLTIEIMYDKWQHLTKTDFLTFNRISIPYPGFTHFFRSSPILKERWSKEQLLQRSRPFTGSTSFGSRTGFRTVLRTQCDERNSTCLHLEVSGHHNFAESINKIAYSTRSAWFCLQPAGDSYSRRSLYDCFALGAIPVVFDEFWLRVFPFADIIDPNLFLADFSKHLDAISKGSNVIDLLEKEYSLERKAALLEGVFEYRHVMQYMLDPVHELVRMDRAWEVHCMDDAFTMSLKSIVRNLCRRNLLPVNRCFQPSPAT